eukprot:TRINITY_DN14042_c0_g4_i1.p1 TRINITY_DN14042_c0_g4~~TRINITY_DN14042_c0_g4_i1.p1  ORF type:complete len:273 (+),score=56.21 TRINITY_DN14042_c0_g4_i1:277-1095(+)
MPLFPTSPVYRDSFSRFLLKPDDLEPESSLHRPFAVHTVLLTTLLPIIITGLLLVIPLGSPIRPWNFVLFQSAYTVIGFPLMLFLFEFMLPTRLQTGSKWPCRLFLLGTGQLIIVPFNLVTYCQGDAARSIVRAMGPVVYAVLIILAFLAAVKVNRTGDEAPPKCDQGVYLDASIAHVPEEDSPPYLDAAQFIDAFNGCSAQLLEPDEARKKCVDDGASEWCPWYAFSISLTLLAALFGIFLFCQWFALKFSAAGDETEAPLVAFFLSLIHI